MIRKFKCIRPISSLGKWLNKMSSQGYRLVRAGDVFYYFEECEEGKYVYTVDYVANKSYEDLKDYERFLNESHINYFEKAASVGKVSKGNLRWRPYADKGAKIATSQGMIKKEFLILEKESDGRPFDIYTNIEDKINALRIMRKPTISMFVFIGIMLLMSYFDFNTISQYRWSLYEIKILPEIDQPIGLVIFGIIEALLFINLIRFTLEINRLKRKREIQE